MDGRAGRSTNTWCSTWWRAVWLVSWPSQRCTRSTCSRHVSSISATTHLSRHPLPLLSFIIYISVLYTAIGERSVRGRERNKHANHDLREKVEERMEKKRWRRKLKDKKQEGERSTGQEMRWMSGKGRFCCALSRERQRTFASSFDSLRSQFPFRLASIITTASLLASLFPRSPTAADVCARQKGDRAVYKTVYRSGTHALQELLRHEGVRALYKGLGVRLVYILPAAGVNFTSTPPPASLPVHT